MNVWLQVLIFLGACLGLIIAGNLLVRSLTKLAAFLRISEFMVAFILLAFGTSVPELFVGINAALSNEPALILGTIIGSNIVNLTLVIGVASMLGRGLRITKDYIRRDAYWMVGLVALPVVLMAIGKELSRVDGIILLFAFGLYMSIVVKKRRYERAFENNNTKPWATLGYFVLFVAALPLLFYSADYVVSSGSELSLMLGLPPLFIGLFFIALGTSLPELFVSAASSLKHKDEITLGNAIGSNVVNSTVVLGIVAIITPITGNLFLFVTSSFFMVIICFLFAVFMETGKKLTWREGIALLMMYILFLMVELNLKAFYLNGAIS